MLVHIFFCLPYICFQPLGIFLQEIHVQPHTFKFHIQQHRHQRIFYFIKNPLHIFITEHWVKNLFQLEGDIRIFSGIFLYLLQRHIAHSLLPLAFFAYERLYRYRLIAEILYAQHIHAALTIGVYHIVGQHGIVYISCQRKAVPLQHDHVILDVLAHPQYICPLKQRTETLQYF